MNTSYYGTPPTSDEITHFGIKGMKWGVRRYENPDGTLTKAGKKRYKVYEDAKSYLNRQNKTDRGMIDYYRKRYNQAKKRYSGKDAGERWLDDAWGEDWKKHPGVVKAHLTDNKDDDILDLGKQYAKREIADAKNKYELMSDVYNRNIAGRSEATKKFNSYSKDNMFNADRKTYKEAKGYAKANDRDVNFMKYAKRRVIRKGATAATALALYANRKRIANKLSKSKTFNSAIDALDRKIFKKKN
jgi:hypothetical protein